MLEEDKYRVFLEVGYLIPFAGFCKEFELRGV